jgi:hypothetical protein
MEGVEEGSAFVCSTDRKTPTRQVQKTNLETDTPTHRPHAGESVIQTPRDTKPPLQAGGFRLVKPSAKIKHAFGRPKASLSPWAQQLCRIPF